jgi:hypothetical protein
LIASFRAQIVFVLEISTGKMLLQGSPSTKQFISSSEGSEVTLRWGTARNSARATAKEWHLHAPSGSPTTICRCWNMDSADMRAFAIHVRHAMPW